MISRRAFLGRAAALAGVLYGTGARAKPMTTTRMPVLFIGHGSPMNAIEDNEFSRAFRKLGAALAEPRAILCVSAHWFVDGVYTTGNERPPTIHDFGGFPKQLFDVQYPARGDNLLATRVAGLIGGGRGTPRDDWGLDHGTWSVLVHMRPKADVPVVQLSIDDRLSATQHLELAKLLAPLRDEGVLILGSGNMTHNLRHAMMAFQRGESDRPDWAVTFDREAAQACEQHDGAALAKLIDTDAGRMSHPTPDHYLPLIYAVGAAGGQGAVDYPVNGWTGSLSMRSVRFS